MENVKQIDCASVEELIQNILDLPRDISTDWIYRGESSAHYTLLPSALRKEGRNKLQLFTRVKKYKRPGICSGRRRIQRRCRVL